MFVSSVTPLPTLHCISVLAHQTPSVPNSGQADLCLPRARSVPAPPLLPPALTSTPDLKTSLTRFSFQQPSSSQTL